LRLVIDIARQRGILMKPMQSWDSQRAGRRTAEAETFF
jgi:hypothetical protein